MSISRWFGLIGVTLAWSLSGCVMATAETENDSTVGAASWDLTEAEQPAPDPVGNGEVPTPRQNAGEVQADGTGFGPQPANQTLGEPGEPNPDPWLHVVQPEENGKD